MTQASLNFLPHAPATIDERFADFHRRNPHVYSALRGIALRALARGITRWSVDALFHVLRWETAIATDSDDGLRLNNTYTSRYARLLMASEPALRGFFTTRRTAAEEG